MTSVILGLSPYHPDAAAALVVDGVPKHAAEEERFSRIKHSAGFPSNVIDALRVSMLADGSHTTVVVARAMRARLLWKLLYGVRMPRLARRRARVWKRIGRLRAGVAGSAASHSDSVRGVRFVEHHRAHLASSFFVSPFDQAVLLSVDGLGDFASGMWGIGRGNKIEVLGEVVFPHSLGFYYTAITQYLGFDRYGDEYKVMGLASFGEPEYLDVFRDIIQVRPGRGYRLDLRYFRHHRECVDMTWEEGPPHLGPLWSEELARRLGRPRDPQDEIEPRHRNIAASLQARLEEVLFEMLRRLHEATGLDALCLAGGVAYNCAANGKIFGKTPFQRVYVPPAPGDAGLAIGAPLWVWHQEQGQPRQFSMDRADWGFELSEAEIRKAFQSRRIEYRRIDSRDELCRVTARLVASGNVVGWCQGRMEFGPRALGNRSILADPRRLEIRDRLNQQIKRREPFRPFAPSILAERQAEYFRETHPSPFMSFAFPVRPERRLEIPAVIHVDGTARLQTVTREANPLFHRLIRAFEAETGVPVLLNTSFNESEPIVCKSAEAVDCYLRTGMDALVLGPFLAEKSRLAKRSLTHDPV